MIHHKENESLIDQFLAEQATLTAVELFSRVQDTAQQPAQAQYYRSLLPASVPDRGQQYAFEVDLDKCSGCKACVTACHALNGLEDDEAWRSVGLLVGQATHPPAEGQRRKGENGFFSSGRVQQHVTTACHHCIDPACLNGCPVLAYEKDPRTGIVRHLDDQCIGCQYCVMKCPYDVPKYSARLGIVRKCDLCSNRLADGEAPACVQACPNEAIRITLAETADVLKAYRSSDAQDNQGGEVGKWESEKTDFAHFPTFSPSHFSSRSSREGMPAANRFLPGSPDPSITLPTTRYLSAKTIPADFAAADVAQIEVQPAHLPLVWMLILTQCAAGGFAVLPFTVAPARPWLAGIALVAGGLGLIGAFLHLGKPLRAWRAFLGWRKSWLSREIAAFVVFGGLAGVTTALLFTRSALEFRAVLLGITALTGLAAVFCSGMVYHDTRREFWRAELSIGKFFGTVAVFGLSLGWFASAAAGAKTAWLPATLATTSIFRLAREFALLRRCADDADLTDDIPASTLGRSAMIMCFRLGVLLRTHVATAWMGGVILPAVGVLLSSSEPWLSGCAVGLCLISEFAERILFFRAVVPFKMPGGVAA